MSAEVEQLKLKGKEDFLIASNKVDIDSFQKIDFLQPLASILVFCGVDNVARILIQPRYERAFQKLDGIIYESEEDNNGRWVDLRENRPIVLRGGQELSVMSYKKSHRRIGDKEVLIYLSNNDYYSNQAPELIKPLRA